MTGSTRAEGGGPAVAESHDDGCEGATRPRGISTLRRGTEGAGAGVGVGAGAGRISDVYDGRNGSGRNVDPECADGEESEKGFGEHDGECCKRGQITTAPGLRLEGLEEGTGENRTAVEQTRERTSNLLYRWAQVRVVELQFVTDA